MRHYQLQVSLITSALPHLNRTNRAACINKHVRLIDVPFPDSIMWRPAIPRTSLQKPASIMTALFGPHRIIASTANYRPKPISNFQFAEIHLRHKSPLLTTNCRQKPHHRHLNQSPPSVRPVGLISTRRHIDPPVQRTSMNFTSKAVASERTATLRTMQKWVTERKVVTNGSVGRQ